MPNAIDFHTVDLTLLLSNRSVQQLLDIVHEHPDWSNKKIFANHPKNIHGEELLTYEQVNIILRRLHLSKVIQRQVRQIHIENWENDGTLKTHKHILSMFPDFLTYLQYRQSYQKAQAHQKTHSVTGASAVNPPLSPGHAQHHRQPRELTHPPEQYRLQRDSLPAKSPQPVTTTPRAAFSSAQQAMFKQFDRFFSLTKQFAFTAFASFLFFFLGSLVFDTIFHAYTLLSRIGMFFAFSALACGMFFFLYSLKYYLTITLILSFSRSDQGEKQTRAGIGSFLRTLFGISVEMTEQNAPPAAETNMLPAPSAISLRYDLSRVSLERMPFVSIHVAAYNEKRVIDRFLLAATAMEYDNYEVIVADDSTDETVQLLEEWKKHPRVKISHRGTREGYKGGALKVALQNVDPRTEFILVLDADFLPYPDAISQFLKYFQAACGSLQPGTIGNSPIAAVQGYQWHVLNKSENWITRGVRSEYAGSYVIERSGTEIYHGLKQISGSVYMIRRDALQTIGWGTSITEDFELTLKLYEQGYKVVYTPYIQAPAEAVSTIKRLIRQRMRWAEGHSYNVKRMFTRLLFSSKLTRSEKLEFLYLSPYYLQAFLFLLGTFSWFVAEVVFKTRLPFWTEVWGWSLVATNLCALPLMNLIGLFLEDSDERDYLGLFSFVVISYIVAPFQAFAAVKGFLEKEEGPWFRTPKTGRITDSFLPSRFSRFLRNILGMPVASPPALPGVLSAISSVAPARPAMIPTAPVLLHSKEACQRKSLSATVWVVLRESLLVRSPGDALYSTGFWCFILGAFVFLLLSYWLPIQDICTRLLMRFGVDTFLQQTTVPYELHFVSTLLTLMGFHIQRGNEYITWQQVLGKNEFIYFTWNCGGWQSFLLFLVSAISGLRGRYTLFSKCQTFLFGIFATYLFTMLRLMAVLVIYISFGRPLGIVFHDYLTIFITFGYLALFWWFAKRFLLTTESNNFSFSHLVFGRGTVAIVVIIALLANYLVFFTHVPVAHASGNPTIEQQINLNDIGFLLSRNTTYTDDTNTAYTNWDSSRYSGSSGTVYYEVILNNAYLRSGDISGNLVDGTLYEPEIKRSCAYNSGSNTYTLTFYTALVAVSSQTVVTGSEQTVTGSAVSGTCPDSSSGQQAQLNAARLIIVQTSTGSITDTDSLINVGYDENDTLASANTLSPLTNLRIWKYNASGYDSLRAIYFAATFFSPGAATASVCLYDVTAQAQVTNGCVSTSSTTKTRVITANDISGNLVDGDEYQVEVKVDTANKSITLRGASVIIQQSKLGGLTKMELYHLYYPSKQTTTSTSYTSPGNYNAKYTPASWAAGTFTYYWEATLKTDTSGQTAYAQLDDVTTSTAVSGSPVSTSNTSYTRVRSASLTSMPTSADIMSAQIKSSASSATTTIINGWLIIAVTSLQTPEHLLPMFPLALFLPSIVRLFEKRRVKQNIQT